MARLYQRGEVDFGLAVQVVLDFKITLPEKTRPHSESSRAEITMMGVSGEAGNSPTFLT